MPLFSPKEVLNLKLNCIPLAQLRELAQNLGINSTGSATSIIRRILEKQQDTEAINRFIKQKYSEMIRERRNIISDDDLKGELSKVKTFSWGVVQGQLDRKIQTEYVRRIVRYDDLLNSVKSNLYDEVTNYVICTWFNHWTTVLIEEHIGSHLKVVPTIKKVKGIDIFFDGQPFDLKVTYLPHGYSPNDAMSNSSELAIWMYENQGAQRFGADNRFFVVLLDEDNPERSWELKRNFNLVFQKIDNFFDRETVSNRDEVIFTFERRTYTAIAKVLIIAK